MSESRKTRRRHIRINNILLIILMILPVAVVGAFAANIIRVRNAETGSGETIEDTEVEKIENEFKNEYYSIGYNATEVSKQYFRELDDAIKKGTPDRGEISAALVKCFVSEYYTWTNKDGNYDIGGMQYIYTDRKADFEAYTRYNFYSEFDLYYTQFGRDALIEVNDVTINSVSQNSGFVFTNEETGEVTTLESYDVDASWTYAPGTSMDVANIQSHALFQVVDHNGRMEIAAINYQEEPVQEENYGY